MVPIVGSTMDSLGQNALAAQQMQDNVSQAISNRLLQQQIANQQNRQVQAQNQTANNEINQRYGYLGNQLAQQAQQWNTPNATATAQIQGNKDVAMLPWTQGLTPAQHADIDLRNQLLKYQMQSPYGMMDPATRGKLTMDAYQNNVAAKEAADAANTAFNAKKAAAIPDIQSRMDSGTDNPNFWTWGMGGMLSGNAARGANILGTENISTPAGRTAADNAEANFGAGSAFNGTKIWWKNQKLPQLAGEVQGSLGQSAGLVRYNPQTEMFEPNLVQSPFAAAQPASQVPPSVATPPPSSTPVNPSPNAFIGQGAKPPTPSPAPTRIVIQNGQRYSMSPDGGSGAWLGPAQ